MLNFIKSLYFLKAAEESHLKVYQALSKLRLEDPRVRIGLWDTLVDGPVMGIAR